MKSHLTRDAVAGAVRFRPGAARTARVSMRVRIRRSPIPVGTMSKHIFLAICRWAAALAAAFAALPAHASFLSGEALDTAADMIAIVVLIVVPVVVIVVFWLVHVLPEKIAEKRHHPQTRRSRRCACCRSCSAGCCGRSRGCGPSRKPVGYKVAYGTDKHDDYYVEMGEKARAGKLLARRARAPARASSTRWQRRARCRRSLRKLRADLDALPSAARRGSRRRRPEGRA